MSAVGAAAVQVGGGIASNIFGLIDSYNARSLARELSSTAHQREVADLKAAGLNPILSATHGGASTPNIQPFRPDNPAEGVYSTYVQSKLDDQMIDQSKEEVIKKAEEIKNIAANTDVATASKLKILQDTKVSEKEVDRVIQEAKREASQTLLNNAQRANAEAEFQRKRFFGEIFEKGRETIKQTPKNLWDIIKPYQIPFKSRRFKYDNRESPGENKWNW